MSFTRNSLPGKERFTHERDGRRKKLFVMRESNRNEKGTEKREDVNEVENEVKIVVAVVIEIVKGEIEIVVTGIVETMIVREIVIGVTETEVTEASINTVVEKGVVIETVKSLEKGKKDLRNPKENALVTEEKGQSPEKMW